MAWSVNQHNSIFFSQDSGIRRWSLFSCSQIWSSLFSKTLWAQPAALLCVTCPETAWCLVSKIHVIGWFFLDSVTSVAQIHSLSFSFYQFTSTEVLCLSIDTIKRQWLWIQGMTLIHLLGSIAIVLARTISSLQGLLSFCSENGKQCSSFLLVYSIFCKHPC